MLFEKLVDIFAKCVIHDEAKSIITAIRNVCDIILDKPLKTAVSIFIYYY